MAKKDKALDAQFKAKWHQDFLANVTDSEVTLAAIKQKIQGKLDDMALMKGKMETDLAGGAPFFTQDQIDEVQAYIESLETIKAAVDPLTV